MKKGLKLFSAASAFALLVGGAFALARQDKKQTLQTKAVYDTTSYTMTARELLGSKERFANCDGVVTDENTLRLTTAGSGQFHFFTRGYNSSYNFNSLSADCESFTVKLKVSSAAEFETDIWARYYEGTTADNYLHQNIDLDAAEAGFVDMVFNRPADAQYFDCVLFNAKTAGGYIDIKSITFNGLTSFELVNFVAFPGGWNYHDRGGTHSTLFEYSAAFPLESGGSDYAAQVGDKITLNGKPFKEAGTIDHAHTGKYLQFTYVDTVMNDLPEGYTQPVIQIHDIVPFEGAFLTPQRIVFDGTQWVVQNLIKDDPAIKNNDYVLFSPDDYEHGGGHDGWFFYTKADQPFAELTGHQSFGIQFTLQTTGSGTGNFHLKLGNSITSGAALWFVYDNVNDGRAYINTINNVGNPDNITNLSMTYPNLHDQQKHLFEFYIIKDSATTAEIIYGYDGIKLFKSSSIDISSLPEWNYVALYDATDDKNTTTVESSPVTTTAALERFYARAVAHPEGNNWMEKYASAKAYYDTFLAPGQRTALANLSAYAGIRDAYDRLRFEAINEYAAPKKVELENYIADLSIYGADEQEEIADIIAEGKAAMGNADTYEEVDELLEEYKGLLDDVPTYAELLAQAKEDAIAELEAYADPDDYREAQQQILAQKVSDGTYRINQATSLEDVAQELATYEGLIDEIPTDAQLLAQYKTEKKAYLDTMAAQILPNYRAAEQQMINAGVAQGKQAIDAANSEAEVDAIIANLQTQLNQLTTDDQYCHQEAAAWDASVDAIGEVTLAKETQIRQVQNAYDDLSATAKGYTTKMPELDQKVNRLNQLLREKAAAEAVDELISAIPDLNRNNYDAKKHLVTEARAAYDALNEEAKGMVTKLNLLQGAEGRIADLEAAIAVDELIDAIGEVTFEKEPQITAAREAYDALNGNQNRFVLHLSVLEAAEARLAELKQEKANAEYVDELINQIGQVDASAACLTKITNARAAYEALNAEEKAMVTGLSTLEAAESAFANKLNQAKDAGVAQADEIYAAVNLKKYSKDNQVAIERLVQNAKAAIQNATDSDAIADILEGLQADIAQIPQKKAAKTGCGGSIVATSVVLSTLALAGLGIAISKKRKED